MSPRIAYIQSARRRGRAVLAVGTLLAVTALGGCTWTEEEWRYLASPALCGIAFNCGSNGNSNMGNQAQSDSDSSSGSSGSNSSSGGGEGTGEAARPAGAQ